MYPDLVKFRAPRGMTAALALAARRRHTTLSEMVRRILLRELELYGLTLDEPTETHPIGKPLPIKPDPSQVN